MSIASISYLHLHCSSREPSLKQYCCLLLNSLFSPFPAIPPAFLCDSVTSYPMVFALSQISSVSDIAAFHFRPEATIGLTAQTSWSLDVL